MLETLAPNHRTTWSFLAILATVFTIGCSDQWIHSITPDDPSDGDVGDDDTGDGDTSDDDAADDGDDDSDGPGDDDTAADPCVTFEFCWDTPWQASALEVQGEFADVNGQVTLPWITWASNAAATSVCASWSMCDEFAFRGEGVAYVDADAVADTWACIYLGGDADDFAQVGDVTCTLDSVDLAVQLTPAPWSDGCEITCTSWEMAP